MNLTLKHGFSLLAGLIQDRLVELFTDEVKELVTWRPKMEVEYNEPLFFELQEKYSPNAREMLYLLLALAPIHHPDILGVFFKSNIKDKIAPSQHGVTENYSKVFVATNRTFAFICGIQDSEYYRIIKNDHFFYADNYLNSIPRHSNDNSIEVGITITDEFFQRLTKGSFVPNNDEKFPAKQITTGLEWEDLVLSDKTQKGIDIIKLWIKHENRIKFNSRLSNRIKRGYRALFYGPSGTGKTLTASLLGKTFNKPVYRIDLTSVVSKYVGETEKNMEKLFSMAENRDWILFFDEAETLFGKRSSGGTANDRYSNQEIGYLLQRIEDYNGILILSTNKLFDLDEAFTRRFSSFVEFPEPDIGERRLLWLKTFDSSIGVPLNDDVDFEKLLHLRITGGILMNVLRTCVLTALDRPEVKIGQTDLVVALKSEYQKENKMWVEVPSVDSNQRILVKSRTI